MNRINRPVLNWLVAGVLMLGLPGLLLMENLDDHDRSGRYAARDFGKNMLASCAQNGVLLTSADNDTYPIWYLQQVEGYRTDVRQLLTTFMPMDWYGNQMNHVYEGHGAVPISFSDEELLMKSNQYFPIVRQIDSAIDVEELIQFVKSDDKRTRIQTSEGEFVNYIPGSKFSHSVNKENFINQSSHIHVKRDAIPETVTFEIGKTYLSRDELLILDMLAQNDWKRPVYALYPNLFHELGLSDYLHREGMLYRFLPYKTNDVRHDRARYAEHQYDLVTKEFAWGNVNSRDIYLDYTTKHISESFRFRQMFGEVANLLIEAGKTMQAEEVLDLAQASFPSDRFKHGYFSTALVEAYYAIGASEKAEKLLNEIAEGARQNLSYFLQGEKISEKTMSYEVRLEMHLIQEMIRLSGDYNNKLMVELASGYESLFEAR